MTTKRVQAGVPAGGQFAPGAHTEAEIALDICPDLDQTGQVQTGSDTAGAELKDTDQDNQGFEPSEAAEYAEAGIEAAAWRVAEFTPQDAAAWHNQGFDSGGASDWRGYGFEAGPARSWSDSGFNEVQAHRWHTDGFAPSEAGSWSAETGMSAERATQWCQYGFGAVQARDWQILRHPSIARSWKDADLTPEQATEWAETGMPVAAAQAWDASGFDPDRAQEWRAQGIDDPEDAGGWADHGFEPDHAAQRIVCGQHAASDPAPVQTEPSPGARNWVLTRNDGSRQLTRISDLHHRPMDAPDGKPGVEFQRGDGSVSSRTWYRDGTWTKTEDYDKAGEPTTTFVNQQWPLD